MTCTVCAELSVEKKDVNSSHTPEIVEQKSDCGIKKKSHMERFRPLYVNNNLKEGAKWQFSEHLV